MPIGRPTKYDESLVERIEQYLIECEEQGEIPFQEELANILNIDTDTIVEWCKDKDKENFSVAIKKLKNTQKLMFQKQGLKETVNTTMAIFLLKANHGLMEASRNMIDMSENISEFMQTLHGKNIPRKDPDSEGGGKGSVSE